MSAAADDSGPAFPQINQWDPDRMVMGQSGMTLRDYFAAKAMHQFLRGSVLPVGFDASEQMSQMAVRAYEAAEAMLKARKP